MEGRAFEREMRTISELIKFTPERDTLLTIGVFDGVHLGHQKLINRLTNQAAARNLLSGVVTFHRHPRRVLAHQSTLARLITLDERTRLLKDIGIDLVVPLTFTQEFAQLTAREFVTFLLEHLRMKGLVIGPDFALGRGREGNVETLKKLGKEIGFTVESVEPLTLEDSVVSSTAIRKALDNGDMEETSTLLGRNFRLKGPVGGGKERGQVLGFPTANIVVDQDQALPINGVYATLSYIGDKVYRSVTNIGVRPTFDEEGRTVEVFIMDFSGDIYGQELAIELIHRLRGEVKFAGPDDLTAQINKDVEQAKLLLK